MKVTVSHCQPVWETTRFEAEIPDGEDPVAYVNEHIADLVGEAIDRGVQPECGDTVEGVDSSLYIYDERGNELKAEYEDDEEEEGHAE